MRNVMFKTEHEHKRVKKIKSRLYRKIRGKNKERQEKKLLEQLETIDPEAAQAYWDRQEELRIQERLSLRHGV